MPIKNTITTQLEINLLHKKARFDDKKVGCLSI